MGIGQELLAMNQWPDDQVPMSFFKPYPDWSVLGAALLPEPNVLTDLRTVLMKPYSMEVSCPPCVFSRAAKPKL